MSGKDHGFQRVERLCSDLYLIDEKIGEGGMGVVWRACVLHMTGEARRLPPF